MIDGDRNARLYETVTEWSTPGLNITDRRGEKAGVDRLANLSTRAPRTTRTYSENTSSCT